jgi:AraC-like DNA-binding protein
MSLRHERLSRDAIVRRREDRPALVFPLESSVVTVERSSGLRKERVDRATFLLLPARSPYAVRALSPITSLATLLVGPLSRARACEDYPDVRAEGLDRFLGSSELLPRTRWVDELVHRYVFEREVCERHTSRAAIFLETEIVKELFFLCREREASHTRDTVVQQHNELVARARAWIDEHPSEPLRVRELARTCHTSESTLLRAFQRELGCTPSSYAREQRLDAALLLVQDGRNSIGEVAARVGYTSLPAFTTAFHRRFGVPPSEARRAPRDLRRLPPRGETPRRPR